MPVQDLNGIFPHLPAAFKHMGNEPIAWKKMENNLKIWENQPFSGNEA